LNEGWGRRCCAHAAALFLIASSAGCASCPKAEKVFDRADPHNALAAFAYAVETGEYRYAYDTLTPKSRDLITFSKFRFALRWGLSAELPDVGEVSIRELIVESKRTRSMSFDERNPRSVVLKVKIVRGTEEINAPIYLEREPEAEAEAAERIPIWRIDLKQTFEQWSASQEFAPARPGPAPPPAAVKTAR